MGVLKLRKRLRKLRYRIQKLPRRLRALRRRVEYMRELWPILDGIHSRECNICGYTGPFRHARMPPRLDARCPLCGSLERHRHQALWIRQNEDALRGKRILHFAPEYCLQSIYRALAARYVTADLHALNTDLKLDLEKMDQPDASWDVIVANHVLEHVDDRKALAEIHRVLVPGGLAILSFPVALAYAKTYENPAVTEPHERHLHFGQGDHLRYYGADTGSRIAAAGFEVSAFAAAEPFVHRHGILRDECHFIARKC